MDSDAIHEAGFIGDTKHRSMTQAITRGMAKSDALFLYTSMLDAVQLSDASMLRSLNKVRLSQMPAIPVKRRAGSSARAG